MSSLPSSSSVDSSSQPAGQAETRLVLSEKERRALGVLVEKGKTTPDIYPLSLNALVAGCNQKSNRDPVLDLSEQEVEEALVSAQKKGLMVKVTGGRVVRWRHALYEVLRADKVELAVLAELLLRGAQTEGELRGRANRMEPIEDLDSLRAILRRLAERGLVQFLGPEGKRGTLVTHSFYEPQEMAQVARGQEESAGSSEVNKGMAAVGRRSSVTSGEDWQSRLAAIETGLSELGAKLEGLLGRVAELEKRL
jgi:uncharacterized protein YceH (UPF0502 family)